MEAEITIIIGTAIFVLFWVLIIFMFFASRKRIIAEQEKKRITELDIQRMLTKKVIQTQEHERKRIAQDIHDECGGLILGIKANIESALFDAGVENLPEKSEMLLDELSVKIRNITRNLYPAAFTHGDLYSALESLSSNYHVQSDVTILINNSLDLKKITIDTQITLYRILSEWINNAITHGKATMINVGMGENRNQVVIEIEDNGSNVNIDKSANNSNTLGLKGIKERISQLDGSYKYSQKKNGNNLFTIELIPT